MYKSLVSSVEFRLVAVMALVLAIGCSAKPPACGVGGATEVSLIDHSQWKQVALKDDPFAAELPGEVTCGAGGYEVENGALEFDTGVCNFITLHQKTQAPAKACDQLRLVFWHLPLYAGKTGAQAYAAVHVGALKVLDERIEIGPKGVEEASFTPKLKLEKDIPAGTDVYVHIHNHGLNSWTLLSLTAHR